MKKHSFKSADAKSGPIFDDRLWDFLLAPRPYELTALRS